MLCTQQKKNDMKTQWPLIMTDGNDNDDDNDNNNKNKSSNNSKLLSLMFEVSVTLNTTTDKSHYSLKCV